MTDVPPRVLTVAGSDSGGGAGIQADLKTITALGGYGASAITALTAQNTCGVRGIHNVPPDFVALQIETVHEDIGLDACKTGMLANAEITHAVASALDRLSIPNLVVDPVMRAKSGDALLEPEAERAVREELLPLATVVTPNLAETGALCRQEVTCLDDMKEAARQILDMGPEWALVKGGHLEGRPTDVLYGGGEMIEISGPRIETRNTHGTGCTYSSAIATRLAFGDEVAAAVRHARAALEKGIRNALPLGSGAGPLDHAAMFEPRPAHHDDEGGAQ